MESHSRQGQATMYDCCVACQTEALKNGSQTDTGKSSDDGGGGEGEGGEGAGKNQRRRPQGARLFDEFSQLRRAMRDEELHANPQLPREDEDSCADEPEAVITASSGNLNSDSSDCNFQEQQQQVQEARRRHHRCFSKQSQVPAALLQRKKHKKVDTYPRFSIEEDPSAELQQLQNQLPLYHHKLKLQLEQLAVSFKGDDDEGNAVEETSEQLSLSLDDTCEFVAALDHLLELPAEEIDFPPPRDEDEDSDGDGDGDGDGDSDGGGETEDAGDAELRGVGVETDGSGGTGVEKRANRSRKSAKRPQQRQPTRCLQQTPARSGDNSTLGDKNYPDGDREEATVDDAASSDSIFNCQPDNAFDFFKLPDI